VSRRRALSAWLCAVLSALGCSRKPPPAPDPAPAELNVASASAAEASPSASATSDAKPVAGPAPSASSDRLPSEERTWSFPNTPIGPMSVVVLLPEREATARFPVLIAMHGRGEALKGPERGARGWVDDYELKHLLERLARPPLTARDFKSFVAPSRLRRFNEVLAEQPYRGLVIVCPYTPDMLTGDDPFSKAIPLAQFLVDELLPRVYRETPAIGTALSTGIDGVSLGGRAALSVGLQRPQAFGAIAALQAAFDREQAVPLTQRAQAALTANPKLSFRLLTSDADYFLSANTLIARSMSAAGIPLVFNVVLGPHDYDFNRGPGGLEMALFHDRVLRGDTPP